MNKFFAAFVVLLPFFATAYHNERVLLKDVTSLILSDSKRTTGRRSSPLPQLKCVGGACREAPSRVMCEQIGWDGRDATWKCQADLDGVKFGKMDVVCEGYDYPDDPYILAGSCGLEYTLDKVGGYRSSYSQGSSPSYSSSRKTESGSGWGSWFFWIVLLCGVGYFLYKYCGLGSSVRNIGGGGGGFGGDGQQPPPYPGTQAPSYPGTQPSSSYFGNKAFPLAPQARPVSQGPGFWSGLLGGGALGYLAGNRRSGAQAHVNQYQQQQYAPAPGYGAHPAPQAAPAGPSAGYAETRRR